MPTLSANRIRRSRLAWLPLLLALFFSGQMLLAMHHHDEGLIDKSHVVDLDCAICAQAASMTAAVAADGWQLAIALIAAVFFTLRVSVRRAAVRFHDSRGPPPLHA
jgi:hypothetical protein